MEARRPVLGLVLSVGALFGEGCDPRAMPSGPSITKITTPTAALTCAAEQQTGRYVEFRVTLTDSPDLTYETTITFGDGREERVTIHTDRGTASRSLSHRYDRNGTYRIDAIARRTDTNDRLTCARQVVYDRCEQSSDFARDDFTFDKPWRRSMVADGPGMAERTSWERTGGNSGGPFDGYRRMAHEFTATT